MTVLLDPVQTLRYQVVTDSYKYSVEEAGKKYDEASMTSNAF
ncbi:MAG: hypothetical protein ACFFD4_19430 [Candidatus Odinarchaeota archaeon]